MQVLTQEEMQRLLIQAKENGCFELLLLELSTGLRRGELLALQWDDLDLATGELKVERQVQRIKGELAVIQPKTKASSRSIILPAPTLDVLKSYRQSADFRWIFPSPRKKDSPLDPAAVRKKLAAVLERAGCKHVRLHDFRHTFATNALERGYCQELCANMFAVSGRTRSAGKRGVLVEPLRASCSCTSCCPTGCRPHGATVRRLA